MNNFYSYKIKYPTVRNTDAPIIDPRSLCHCNLIFMAYSYSNQERFEAHLSKNNLNYIILSTSKNLFF